MGQVLKEQFKIVRYKTKFILTTDTKNVQFRKVRDFKGIRPVKLECDKSRCVKSENSPNLGEMGDPVKSLKDKSSLLDWRVERGYYWNETCLEVGGQAQSLVLSSRHNERHPMSSNLCSCSKKEFLDMTESLGLLCQDNNEKH